MKDLFGGRITRIAAQERDANRLNVDLDGVFAFGVSREIAAEERLEVGMELPAERVAAIIAHDQIGKATDRAINLLARRPRSTREIRDRLRQKGFEPPTIDAAVEKLEGWNYVDDAEFARYWVENRESHKPRGRRLLEQELRTKGVERDVIRDAIDDAGLDERASALEVGRAKLRTYAGLEPLVARRRLGSFLARRGYDYGTVRTTVDQLLGEQEDDS
ncbi:MAG: regulatory protein RecX [Thermomicrobiales bacterium]